VTKRVLIHSLYCRYSFDDAFGSGTTVYLSCGRNCLVMKRIRKK